MTISFNSNATNEANPASELSYDGYLKLGFLLIFSLVAGFMAWSILAPIQGAIIAPGSVIVEGKPKTLQHLSGGIVGEILVTDGDKVQAGDVVIRLDPISLNANRNLLQKRLNEAQVRVARLKAERDGISDISWSTIFENHSSQPDLTTIIEDQTKLFKTRRKGFSGEVKQLNKQIEQSYQQIAGLRGQISSNNNQLDLIRKELQGLRSLLAKGFVSQTRVLALEREEEALSGQIANFRSDIARINTAVGEIEIEILQVSRNQQEAVLTDLRTSESEINDLEEQLISAVNDIKHIDIIAPVSGTVHNMTMTTLGGVITPANPIMDIIPDTGRLIVESQIEPASVDQVYVGQLTTVRLSAFNQRTTPELNGKVFAISANTIVDPVNGIPFYTVKIEIPSQELDRLNGLQLVPGMPAEAYMQTDKRSAISYLLKPATDQLNRAFREE